MKLEIIIPNEINLAHTHTNVCCIITTIDNFTKNKTTKNKTGKGVQGLEEGAENLLFSDCSLSVWNDENIPVDVTTAQLMFHVSGHTITYLIMC